MNATVHPPADQYRSRDAVLSILRDFKREFADEFGILAIGIFGSVARDAAGVESDLDICVKTKTPNPYILVHIKDAIEGRVHRKVDIVRVRDHMNPLLKEQIEREGIYV
jgi:predicted nucleotidyltransferase